MAEERDPFSDARPGFVRIEDMLGRLILVNPKEVIEKKSTLKGREGEMYDVIVGDVCVLDGPEDDVIENVPSVHDDLHISGSVITGQLRGKVSKPAEQGGLVLGRVAKQKSQTKGFGDAWVLNPPTEEDKALARPAAKAYLAELAAANPDPFA